MLIHIRDDRILLALCIACTAGCVSTHNFATDDTNALGGGFYESHVRPGLYELTVRSNNSPMPPLSFLGAKLSWQTRAEQLCGKDSYTELASAADTEYVGIMPSPVPSPLPVPLFSAVIRGYVLCKSSELSVEEANNIISTQAVKATHENAEFMTSELSRLGGGSCSDTEQSDTPETYLLRGRLLIGLKRYDEAMSCLLSAQKEQTNTYVYRESCALIGLMYELGWGVKKDKEIAAAWQRKAGM